MAHEHSHSYARESEERAKIIIAAVFFLAGYIISEFTSLPDYVYLICFVISYVSVGFGVVREALEDILSGKIFGECFLISVASLGALVIKDYSEGCAVMLLYAIGEFIQGAVLQKSRKSIEKLAGSVEHKCPEDSGTERFISHFARIYTPVICAVAVLVVVIPPIFLGGEWKEWIHRGLSALVIGCPCAIVISVPLAFSCAMAACAKAGVYVHSANALEALNKNREGDIVLAGGNIETAEKAAKKAAAISSENVFFALSVKLVILVLAVFLNREIPVWAAEFGDIGVAILAILNSLRALRV